MTARLTNLMRHSFLGLAAMASFVPALQAQNAVPAVVQAAILTRLLTYDRALTGSAADGVVVGTLAKSQDRSSAKAQADLEKALMILRTGRLPIRLTVVSTGYQHAASLKGWLAENKVRVLYVAPGLSAELDAIRDVCVAEKIITITPVRDFVERGLVAGIVVKDNRPSILLNLPAATAAGMDLDPKLLELSEIIR